MLSTISALLSIFAANVQLSAHGRPRLPVFLSDDVGWRRAPSADGMVS